MKTQRRRSQTDRVAILSSFIPPSNFPVLVGRAESFLRKYVSQYTVGHGVEFSLLYQTCSSSSMIKIKRFILKRLPHTSLQYRIGLLNLLYCILFAWRELAGVGSLSTIWIWRLNSIPWAGWQVLLPLESSC